MITELCIGLLCLVRAEATTTSSPTSPDLEFKVYFPIILVAIVLIIGIIWCYCYFRKSPYEVLNGNQSEANTISSFSDLESDSNFGRQQRGKFTGGRQEFGLPIGLENNGSECYMNSAIQAMASSDKIIFQFIAVEEHIPGSNTLKTFLKLLKGVNNTDNNTASVNSNTKLLKSLLGHIGWQKTQQQDCHDFMSAIINAIHKDLKQVPKKVEPPMKYEMLHKVMGCSFRDKLQYHVSMSLCLCGTYERSPGVPLDYLINEYLSASNIDGDSLKTTQMFVYQKPPEVLVLHIQANKWDPVTCTMIKPEYYIQYDRYLRLDLIIMNDLESDERFEQTVNYQLHAVVNHMGDYTNGHYVKYRYFKGLWVLTNDQQVQYVRFDKTICPYILIYEKIEGNSGGSWI